VGTTCENAARIGIREVNARRLKKGRVVKVAGCRSFGVKSSAAGKGVIKPEIKQILNTKGVGKGLRGDGEILGTGPSVVGILFQVCLACPKKIVGTKNGQDMYS